jgi:hypothetical protein
VIDSHGTVAMKGSLELDIVFVPDNNDDLDNDSLSRVDFTGFKSHMSVNSGFSCCKALPKFARFFLSLFGAKPCNVYDVALGALYEESGFDTYSREECDSMYVNSILKPVKSNLLRGILAGMIMPLVGNKLRWNNSSEQTSVATLQPLW